MNLLGIILVFAMVVVFYKIYFDVINGKEEKYTTLGNFARSSDMINNYDQGTKKENDMDDEINKKIEKIEKKNKKNLKDLKDKYSSKNMEKNVSKYLDKMIKMNDELKKESILKAEINQFFQEIQFHQDYRDTMNGFNLMTEQKDVFNRNYEPLLKTEKPEIGEVSNIVDQFIDSLNEEIMNNVGEVGAEKLNSWADNMQPVTSDNNIIKNNSSWEEYNNELGLPNTIYKNPAKKEKINLVKIDNIDKYETNNQIKYSIYLILQKKNVKDQMVVKVSFVIDKSDIDLERDFFKKNKNNYETKIIVEEISIIGFLIKNGSGKPKTHREKFYDYEGFSEGRLISEKDVIRQLNSKRKEIEENFISHM